jgi:hypothetical protein
MQAGEHSEPARGSVVSPFSDAGRHSFETSKRSRLPLWIALAIVVIGVIGAGGFFLLRHLNDPLRTLEPFPVTKYMDGYKALAGSKFRADLRVENDLGWKEGIGRVMVFTTRDDPHPIVVMLPQHLAQTYFTKGQQYQAELEVKEGGLIYANSCRKN